MIEYLKKVKKIYLQKLVIPTHLFFQSALSQNDLLRKHRVLEIRYSITTLLISYYGPHRGVGSVLERRGRRMSSESVTAQKAGLQKAKHLFLFQNSVNPALMKNITLYEDLSTF